MATNKFRKGDRVIYVGGDDHNGCCSYMEPGTPCTVVRGGLNLEIVEDGHSWPWCWFASGEALEKVQPLSRAERRAKNRVLKMTV